MCPAHIPWLENGIAVRCLWPEPLGCFSRLPASICPVLLVSPLLWECPIHRRVWRREPSPSPCCALCLCSAPELALPNCICYKLVLGTSPVQGVPVAEQGANGNAPDRWGVSITTGCCGGSSKELELHPRVILILLEARAAPQHSCCAGAPLSPARWLWPG